MSSCSKDRMPLSEGELKAYVTDPENGVIKTRVKDAITLEMTYWPKDLVIANEAGDDTIAWQEAERRLDSLDFFILHISRDGEEVQNSLAGSEARFNHAISWLSRRIGNDLYLTTEAKERIAPEQTVFIPSFGSARATSVLIAFRSFLSKREGEFSVVLTDSEFGTGTHEFLFDSRNIRRIPRLQR